MMKTTTIVTLAILATAAVAIISIAVITTSAATSAPTSKIPPGFRAVDLTHLLVASNQTHYYILFGNETFEDSFYVPKLHLHLQSKVIAPQASNFTITTEDTGSNGSSSSSSSSSSLDGEDDNGDHENDSGDNSGGMTDNFQKMTAAGAQLRNEVEGLVNEFKLFKEVVK